MELGNECDIAEMIHNGGVYTDVEGKTPQEIYKKISNMIKLPDGVTAEQVYNSLCDREKVLSTAVGNGIALPHARSPIMKNVNKQMICVVYLKEPINMSAPDDRMVYVMFVLLTQNSQVHIQVLKQLANCIKSMRFRKALERKADEANLLAVLRELD